MKKSLMLAALLAMGLAVAVPAMAQDAPADPDTPVSGAPGGGTTNPSDCEKLKATGADVDCDAPRTSDEDEPVSGTPGDQFGGREECERFNEQYGTEIDCSVLEDAGTVSGDGGNAPEDPPVGGGDSSSVGASASADGRAASSGDGRTLPATGGGALVALGAGASLIACGLLTRKLLAHR